MTAQTFRPNFPRREKEEHVEGNFISRGITVTEGSRAPSGLKTKVGSPDAGSVHRSSVSNYQHPKLDHKPYSSVHRPEIDEGALKANQTQMLTTRQKRKRKESKD
jgi:hypothetical protein